MRTFLILCSAISATYAASLGYNYESNSGASLSGGLGSGFSLGSQGAAGPSFSAPGLSFGSGVSSGPVGGFSLGGSQGAAGPSFSAPGLSFGSGVSSGPVGGFSLGGSQGAAGPSFSAPSQSFGSGVSSGPLGGFSLGGQGVAGPSYSAPAPAAPAETIKEFYTYTAPEHEFNDIGDNSQITSSLKKNLRVIFIKGPESNGLENAAVQLANSVVNEQTAIYVLNKQADIGDLANKLQSIPSQHLNKPEVHFVKYRTSADAENAQQAIQSQYNGLNGPSSSHNGGVAPLLNFASNPAPAPVAQQSFSAAPVGNVETSYLPPQKKA